MRTHMHIVVDWVGVTSAMIAKERLKAIIAEDRQAAPAYRWVGLYGWAGMSLIKPGAKYGCKSVYRLERRK